MYSYLGRIFLDVDMQHAGAVKKTPTASLHRGKNRPNVAQSARAVEYTDCISAEG